MVEGGGGGVGFSFQFDFSAGTSTRTSDAYLDRRLAGAHLLDPAACLDPQSAFEFAMPDTSTRLREGAGIAPLRPYDSETNLSEHAARYLATGLSPC